MRGLLTAYDISVPPRTGGRKTPHTEIWTFCRLASTLAKCAELEFPLSVCHQDRPDFLVRSDKIEIGVEVTEAISEQFAAYCSLAQREFSSTFLDPAHFRWDAPKCTADEMRELLRQSQLSSDGWAGDRPEKEWALFLQSAFDAKLFKLARPEFKKFDQNWLSVYDNLSFSNIDLGKAITYLRPLLQDRWDRTPGFHALFVEHGPIIVRITATDSYQLKLNDLWSEG